MTPDWAVKPVTVPYAKFGDPQSLNLYSFVENGPVNRIDPDGHEDEVPADPSGGDPGSSGQAKAKTPPAQNTVSGTTVTTVGTPHVNEDGSVTTVKETTTATFSTERGHEGEFVGATQQDTVTVTHSDGSESVVARSQSVSISEADASKAMGRDFTDTQERATPGKVAEFGHQVKQDFKQHPFKQVGIIVSGAAIPVGYVAPLVGAGMSALGIITAVSDDATHIAPYQ